MQHLLTNIIKYTPHVQARGALWKLIQPAVLNVDRRVFFI